MDLKGKIEIMKPDLHRQI